MTLQDNLLGLVPITALQRTLQTVIVSQIQVGENTVFVRQVAESRFAGNGVGVGVGGSCKGARRGRGECTQSRTANGCKV